MTYFRYITAAIVLLFFCELVKAQDPQFTQFYSNPMYQSPSFAGAVEGYRFSVNHRTQWPKLMSSRVVTTSAALDFNMSALNSGVGLIVMQDKLGTTKLKNLNLGLLYSYNVKISRKIYFRPGLGVYYSQRSIDYSRMLFSSEIDSQGSVKPIDEHQLAPINSVDASASALLMVNNFWVGLTTDHLVRPNISFSEKGNRLPIKYNLFGGVRLHKMERLVSAKRQSITIVGSLRHQGQADQLDFGLYWTYEPLILGVWYRDLPFIKDYTNRDAISILLGYKYKNITAGYSYDITVSRLITSVGGAHEVSLVYKFDIEQRKKFKPIPCPYL